MRDAAKMSLKQLFDIYDKNKDDEKEINKQLINVNKELCNILINGKEANKWFEHFVVGNECVDQLNLNYVYIVLNVELITYENQEKHLTLILSKYVQKH